MCVAMNRSLNNVILGGYGTVSGGPAKVHAPLSLILSFILFVFIIDVIQSVSIQPKSRAHNSFSPFIQVIEGRVHTEIDASGAAESLRNAEKIVIVPGYGLAVAQAAGVVAEIALKLRKEGKDVKFAVHPVVSTSEKSSVTPCGADSLSVCTYLRYLSYISCIFVLIRRAECLDS
jgi:NAD/NADP transhydrogenase beta subunit